MVIDGAMSVAGGTHTEALAYLNDLGWEWTMDRLTGAIANNKFLSDKWASNKVEIAPAPSEVTDIDRPVHIDEANTGEIVSALQRQEVRLRDTLGRLGIVGTMQEQAIAARDLQSNFSAATLSMMGGGITDVFFKLKSEAGAILDEIRPHDPDQKPVLERESMLRNNLVDIINAMQGCHDRAMKALMLEMEAKSKRNEKSKRPKGQLGITAMAGATVQVAMQK